MNKDFLRFRELETAFGAARMPENWLKDLGIVGGGLCFCRGSGEKADTALKVDEGRVSLANGLHRGGDWHTSGTVNNGTSNGG